MNAKAILFTGTLLSAFLFLGGCASQSDLDEVRVLAEEAQSNAVDAMVCCEANSIKIDRMYQKIISK